MDTAFLRYLYKTEKTMKKGFNIFMLFLGIFLLASCSKEKGLPSPNQNIPQDSENSTSIFIPTETVVDTVRVGLYLDKKVSNTKSKNNQLNGSSNFVKAP